MAFTYDFARNEPFHPEDLQRIEARMAEIIKANSVFMRETVSRDEAHKRFDKIGEGYKLELLDAIPADEPVTIYHQDGWFDLCRGPHGTSTGRIGAFKLTKVAGSYWRGDSRNAQLQRIYGTAFASEKELKAYLRQIEEAEKRDHRRLGREMGLFHIQEEAAGSVFWPPKGWIVYREMESYVRRRLDKAGYVEVKTPQIYDRVFWERSGHWDKFRENMFTLESENQNFGHQADELSGPCADLQSASAQLSRFAPAHGGVRLLSPGRALGRLAWDHAGAGFCPGRCAYLLYRGSGH